MFISSRLDQDIEHVTVLINRSPRGALFAIDFEKHFIGIVNFIKMVEGMGKEIRESGIYPYFLPQKEPFDRMKEAAVGKTHQEKN